MTPTGIDLKKMPQATDVHGLLSRLGFGIANVIGFNKTKDIKIPQDLEGLQWMVLPGGEAPIAAAAETGKREPQFSLPEASGLDAANATLKVRVKPLIEVCKILSQAAQSEQDMYSEVLAFTHSVQGVHVQVGVDREGQSLLLEVQGRHGTERREVAFPEGEGDEEPLFGAVAEMLEEVL